jgi:hypothetical protein
MTPVDELVEIVGHTRVLPLLNGPLGSAQLP